MDSTPEIPTSEQLPRHRRRRSKWSLRLTPGGLLILLLINAIILGLLVWPVYRARLALAQPGTPTLRDVTATVTRSASPEPSQTDTPQPSTATPEFTSSPSTAMTARTIPLQQGLIILAIDEGANTHLFAYQPAESQPKAPVPLTRLTGGPWDDIQPALSPDGQRLAFVSNRNGYWDLYVMDVSSGIVTRLTDSLEYDGAPSWSPDGLWLAYESYQDENLELMIRSVDDPQQAPIRLTNHPASDSYPAWSPLGRQIAFVSNRSGEPEIWLVDLDKADENLFVNISQDPGSLESHPAWSQDGKSLAWTAVQDGYRSIFVADMGQLPAQKRYLGSGDWPVWSPDHAAVLTALVAPNRSYLTAYPLDHSGTFIQPIALPGEVRGLAWGGAALPLPVRDPYLQAARLTPTPLWMPALKPQADAPGGRQQLIEQTDLQAPHPFFNDLVDEAFQALRKQLAEVIGWDALSTLENAYVPLTDSLDPGMGDDWLYTGRAFALTTLPMNAGWMAVVREDYGQQTYWRVYLRARFQDGSAGMPLYDQPWDFNARYEGDVQAYEDGGRLIQTVPPGYWLDFTEMAQDYGWERLPALSTWRSSFPAARFNEFALVDNLDWRSAMLEIYPPEVMITPSPVIPPTRTSSPTPRWYQSPTPTLTPTPRPTLTPFNTFTPTFTLTPNASPTQTPAATARPSQTATPSSKPPTPTLAPATPAESTPTP